MTTVCWPLRSFLFVPAHRRSWIAKAVQCGPDAVVLDLEDSVPPEQQEAARACLPEAIAVRSKGKSLSKAFQVAPEILVDNDWSNPAELRRIYVDADRHSTGVAAELMQASLDFVRHTGHDWIWLGTNEANTRAVRFYEKYGFRIVGKRTFCVADSIECDHVLARPVR